MIYFFSSLFYLGFWNQMVYAALCSACGGCLNELDQNPFHPVSLAVIGKLKTTLWDSFTGNVLSQDIVMWNLEFRDEMEVLFCSYVSWEAILQITNICSTRVHVPVSGTQLHRCEAVVMAAVTEAVRNDDFLMSTADIVLWW